MVGDSFKMSMYLDEAVNIVVKMFFFYFFELLRFFFFVEKTKGGE